jgi:hypothetical protein
MTKYELKHGENYSYVENVLSDDEIKYLMNHWDNIDIGTVLIGTNGWDVWSDKKTVIDINSRYVEIVGIPKHNIDFLSEKIKTIFSLVVDYDFGIEGPHYFTKYPTGGFHSRHKDGGTHNNVTRDKVITIQLTDENEYEGGDLIINGEMAPRSKGTFILYSGMDPHEVTKVTEGERYSITECAGERE